MIFVFALVAAFIFLCLWGMVKMGSDSDELLMDLFSGEERRRENGGAADTVFNGGAININNFGTEYSEEFVENLESIGDDVFDELPDSETDYPERNSLYNKDSIYGAGEVYGADEEFGADGEYESEKTKVSDGSESESSIRESEACGAEEEFSRRGEHDIPQC